MTDENETYRVLQQNLDAQAVGFGATRSGADIRLLKRLFTEDEAKVAARMSYKPATLAQIAEKTAPDFSAEQTELLLNSMFKRGAIAWKKKDGADCWYLMPLIVGMYEGQGETISADFLADADAYMKTMAFGKAFLGVKPSQMRTVPINRSISAEHHVATYDQIRELIRDSPGPFVVIKCICRETKAMRGKKCTKTARLETCMGLGHMAAMGVRRKQGREISRDEALEVMQKNEDDGLVLQPANAQQPDFVCSCCGCCCGMLGFQKFLPHPLDFWTTNFYAEINQETCISCRKCTARCQVGAVTMEGHDGKARIDLNRCIGCGLCVPTCPSKSIRLKKKEAEIIPPKDDEALYDEIKANKPGALAQAKMLFKVALKMKQ
jgi:Pyruvate/2-oxoacid:ferredoxin oxidoreductase delta subunit